LSRPLATLAALCLAALTFRPQIVGAGPLFPSIQEDLDVSHAVVGLLGTIPVLCMGLFAPPAALVVRRIGTRAAIGLAVGLIGVFGLARAAAPGAALVVLATWPVGMGMGLGGAIAPVAVKERFAARSGFATGVYTTGIQVGSAISASVAVPLAHVAGGWRGSLGVFSGVTCLLLVGWLVLTRGDASHSRPVERPPLPPLRRGGAWLLVAIFALMASTYYGLNNWLPDSFVERGWSDGRAGWLLAVLNIAAIPGSFAVPWLSDHFGGRPPWLVGVAGSFLAGVLGFTVLPDAGWVWAGLVGVASGAMFALVMTLPLDLEHDPRRVGALVGMMLGLGYTIGALSPFVLGVVRDATGTFTGSLWLIVAFCAAMLAAVAGVPRATRQPAAP
jgi:MFS transporter, CP family, cyanate transporter